MEEGEPGASPRSWRDRPLAFLIAGLSAALAVTLLTLFFSARDANHDRESFKKQAKDTNEKLDADRRERQALRDALEKAGVNPDTVVIPGPAGTQGPAGPAGPGGPVTSSSSQFPGPPGPTTTSTSAPSSTTTTARPPLVTLPTLPRPPLRAR